MTENPVWRQIRCGLNQFVASTGMHEQIGQATYIEWTALNDLNERLKKLEHNTEEKP